MRILAALVLAVLVLAPAQAQPSFEENHQIRIAYGDIPTTTLVEPEGVWNVHTTFRIPVDGSVTWTLPSGHFFVGSGCTDCTSTRDDSAAPTYTATCTSSSATDGLCSVSFDHHAGSDVAFGDTMEVTDGALVVLYVPVGNDVVASSEAELELTCTAGDCTIRTYHPAAGDFWFVSAPTDLQPVTTVVAPTEGGLTWWLLAVGLVVGAGVWYVLVNQGLVQKRQRKQVAGTAEYKEVAAREDKPTLEGRKRVLMAALKELEVAKMNKEMDTAVYDALKADFKKQAVTAMRAIEESA